jgi:hypothetical protein
VTRRPPSVRSARQGFDRGNRLAAMLVLADVQRYGGEGAGLVRWARAVIQSNTRRIEGPLFPKQSRAA